MESITLRQLSAGAYVDGLWVEGANVDSIIRASVQPLSTAEYRRLPEGDSPMKYREVYTNVEMKIPDKNASPDEIIHKGLRYKMATFSNWIDNGYTSAVFKQVDE